MRGTITNLVADRGFGYIDGGDGTEYFFHRNATKSADWGQFAPGSRVVFDVHEEAGDRPGEHLRAINVELTEDSPVAVDHELLPEEKAPEFQG